MLRLSLAAFLLLITALTASTNAATVLLPQCAPKGSDIVCDVRFGSNRQNYLPLPAKTPSEIRVQWPDGQEETVPVTRYDPETKTTALLFMIDLSLSMKTSTVKKLVTDLSDIVRSKRGNEQIGIATFAEDLNIVAPVGSSTGLILERLSQLKPYGNRTYISRSTYSALDHLAGSHADRKAIVLLTDGKEEDARTNEREVIDHAKELQIPIYTVGYLQDKKDLQSVVWLSRLASETYGPSVTTDLTQETRPDWRFIDPDITVNIFRFLENGGTITFPRRANEAKLIAEVDGAYVSSAVTFLAPAPITRRNYALEWLYKNPAVVAGIAFFLLLGFGSLIWLLPGTSNPVAVASVNLTPPGVAGGADHPQGLISDRSRGERDYVGGPERHGGSSVAGEITMLGRDAPAARSGGGAGTVYAWLERLDRPGEQIAVKKTSVTIGRHQDNDLKFEDLSVHRRHAVLHMTPNREFVITDLSREGGNGVKVNSKKVEKQALREGDVIEIGTVRLTFHAASA